MCLGGVGRRSPVSASTFEVAISTTSNRIILLFLCNTVIVQVKMAKRLLTCSCVESSNRV